MNRIHSKVWHKLTTEIFFKKCGEYIYLALWFVFFTCLNWHIIDGFWCVFANRPSRIGLWHCRCLYFGRNFENVNVHFLFDYGRKFRRNYIILLIMQKQI